MNATVNAAQHPPGIRLGKCCMANTGQGQTQRQGSSSLAGNRNHKNNNHIIVFNNEKYHLRHNFWLLFVQQPTPQSRTPAFWLAAVERINP